MLINKLNQQGIDEIIDVVYSFKTKDIVNLVNWITKLGFSKPEKEDPEYLVEYIANSCNYVLIYLAVGYVSKDFSEYLLEDQIQRLFESIIDLNDGSIDIGLLPRDHFVFYNLALECGFKDEDSKNWASPIDFIVDFIINSFRV